VILASVPFSTVPSLDRYMLPLIPPLLLATAPALRPSSTSLRAAFIAIALFAIAGVGMTRDWLTFQGAVWQTAHQAIASGVPITSLDGGAGWSGYHLYQYSRENGLHNTNPNAPSWIQLWDLATDRCIIVATTPHSGMEMLARTPYDQWFGADGSLYLLSRCEPFESAAGLA
jgi:hypothetical protein